MLFRNKVSPYENKTLKGVVRETWLRGRPSGRLLLEPRKMLK
jgi:allantoinase